MKVLFLLTSLGAGGTERSTAVLLPELRARGVHCEVAVLKRVQLGDENAVLAQGFEIREIRGRNIVEQVRALRRVLEQTKPDILHTAIFDADIVGRLAGWRSPVWVVSSLVNTSYDPVRLRDSNVPRWKLRLARFADAWTARHLVDRLHAVSDGVATANSVDLRLPMEQIQVVERGRTGSSMQPSHQGARRQIRSELGILNDTPVVLAVGRVEYQKGHVTLLEAISALKDSDLVAQPVVLIAGRPGNASRAVEGRIEELGLTDTVYLLGHRSDVPDLLAAADVFVLPSLYEGTAGVVIEAMAAGVPIVSSNVQGLVGVLDDEETALLVPIEDPQALSEALQRVLARGGAIDAMVRNASTQFEDRFTLKRSADRMVALYESVIDR